MRPHQVIIIIILVVTLYLVRGLLAINTSESLPKGAYVLTSASEVTTGDLVLFRHEEAEAVGRQRGYLRRGSSLGKRIVAIPGDQITVGEEVRINGQRVGGPPRNYDAEGRVMETFAYTGIVPDGLVFVLGDTPNSYDSRYYGFVNKKNIINTLIPLWIWK